MRLLAYFSCIVLLLTLVETARAQVIMPSSDSLERMVQIDRIFVTGNKKTKEHIITRELDVRVGESYSIADLGELLELDRNKIYNTSLFNEVRVSVLDLEVSRVVIQIDVAERWYLYPIPKIDFIDRNFNDWVENHGADLSRLNYGIKFTQYNFRGRNERLYLTIQGGFTPAIGLRYLIPYIDKNQRTGMAFKIEYGERVNTVFNTVDHFQRFVDGGQVIRTEFVTNVGVTRRRSFYNSHKADLGYVDRWAGDTLRILNPNYFLDSASRQQFFLLSYGYDSDYRDIQAYPLRGYIARFEIRKYGLGIFDDLDLWQLRASYAKYWPLPSKFYLSNYSSVMLSTPGRQPYSNYYGLGYERDLVRGYELNVVEGRSYLLNKTTFKRELFKTRTRIKAIPVEQFQTFPFALYAKVYFDVGYVNNLDNNFLNTRLSNDLIYGTGFGLDIFTTYDLVIRTEYSFNSAGSSGFFFHFKKEF